MFKRHVTATVAAVGIAFAAMPLAAESHSDPMGMDKMAEAVEAPTETDSKTIALVTGALLILAMLAHGKN